MSSIQERIAQAVQDGSKTSTNSKLRLYLADLSTSGDLTLKMTCAASATGSWSPDEPRLASVNFAVFQDLSQLTKALQLASELVAETLDSRDVDDEVWDPVIVRAELKRADDTLYYEARFVTAPSHSFRQCDADGNERVCGRIFKGEVVQSVITDAEVEVMRL